MLGHAAVAALAGLRRARTVSSLISNMTSHKANSSNNDAEMCGSHGATLLAIACMLDTPRVDGVEAAGAELESVDSSVGEAAGVAVAALRGGVMGGVGIISLATGSG